MKSFERVVWEIRSAMLNNKDLVRDNRFHKVAAKAAITLRNLGLLDESQDDRNSETFVLSDKIISGLVWNYETQREEHISYSFLDAVKGRVPGVKIHEIMQELVNQITEQTGDEPIDVVGSKNEMRTNSIDPEEG